MTHSEDIKIIEEKYNLLRCSLDTLCESNGNCVSKIVTFYTNGQWQLDVSGQSVDLEQHQIANTYRSGRNGVNIVLTAVRKVSLCEGITVTNNIIMTRFHIIDKWKSNGKTQRILRSKLCNRIIPFNAQSKTCIKCQKMTMLTKSYIDQDKENYKPSDSSTIPTPRK